PLLGRAPRFAVLKGRHHYLCLAKLESSTAEEPDGGLFEMAGAGGTTWLAETGRLGQQIQRLRDWGLETATGDRDELDPGVDDTAWRQVSMPARECVGAARCPFGAECFAEASRERARSADVVVTNHSLLAVDMLTGHQIIPPHRLLVVDEAHELADRVSSAAQAELTAEGVDRAARRARTLLEPEVYEALTEAGDALALGLAETPPGRLTGPLPPALHSACTLLDAAARAALTGIGEVKPDDPDGVAKQPARAVLEELSATAQRLVAADESDVAWVERPEWAGGGRRALVVAPLSVAGTLATHLYRDRVVVATSATLALGGAFDTIARTLGLPAAPAKAGVDRPPAGPAGRGGARCRGGGPGGSARPRRCPRAGRHSRAGAARRAALVRPGCGLAVRLPPAGHPLRGGAPAPPARVRAAGALRRRAGPAGERAGRAYPRAVLIPAGGRAGRRGAAGAHRPADAAAGRGDPAAAGATLPRRSGVLPAG